MGKAEGAKQGVLEGTLSERIKAVEAAAEDYAEKRDARMDAGKIEKEAKDKLVTLMGEKKIDHYKRGKFEIELVAAKIKVRVRIDGDESEEFA